jgi:hypothetical protein
VNKITESRGILYCGYCLQLMVFGLLPVILIIVAYYASGVNINWEKTTIDGGLLTFTTATISTGIYSILSKGKGNAIIAIFTIVAVVTAIVCACLFFYSYMTALGIHRLGMTFPANYMFLQIIVTAYAVFYAILIEAHIGGFKTH